MNDLNIIFSQIRIKKHKKFLYKLQILFQKKLSYSCVVETFTRIIIEDLFEISQLEMMQTSISRSWINLLSFVSTVEYYTAIKRNKILRNKKHGSP